MYMTNFYDIRKELCTNGLPSILFFLETKRERKFQVGLLYLHFRASRQDLSTCPT